MTAQSDNTSPTVSPKAQAATASPWVSLDKFIHGREDASDPGSRVTRGGAWYYSRKLARYASREGLLPTYILPALGSRVALTPGHP